MSDRADRALDAVGDPTRRRILALLRERPRPVGELAASLPVSRPAVSKHLRILKEAELVADSAVGTRRIYRLRPEGVAGLTRYWEEFWTVALEQFKAHAERRGE